MKKTYYQPILFAMLFLLLSISGAAFGWHDKTHLAIAQAAGYENWYNAAGADITKTKADEIEAKNHWYNNADGEVTAKMVMDQIKRYNKNEPEDAAGHLYGAIIASLKDYIREIKDPSKYAEYHLAFCAHYIGDLSMPLHNMPYKDEGVYNDRVRHRKYDGTIEFSVLNNIGLIQKNMYEIKIESYEDLAREIARIANISHSLALKLEKEHRDNKEREMNVDEAYHQIYHSASLLKAVLTCVKTPKCIETFVSVMDKQ
jgi:hypothetical protein